MVPLLINREAPPRSSVPPAGASQVAKRPVGARRSAGPQVRGLVHSSGCRRLELLGVTSRAARFAYKESDVAASDVDGGQVPFQSVASPPVLFRDTITSWFCAREAAEDCADQRTEGRTRDYVGDPERSCADALGPGDDCGPAADRQQGGPSRRGRRNAREGCKPPSRCSVRQLPAAHGLESCTPRFLNGRAEPEGGPTRSFSVASKVGRLRRAKT
jgi:hypothetical protein